MLYPAVMFRACLQKALDSNLGRISEVFYAIFLCTSFPLTEK